MKIKIKINNKKRYCKAVLAEYFFIFFCFSLTFLSSVIAHAFQYENFNNGGASPSVIEWNEIVTSCDASPWSYPGIETYKIEWTGSASYTMVGKFTFEDDQAGDIIDETQVLDFEIDACDGGIYNLDCAGGTLLESFDGVPDVLNFDSTAVNFLTADDGVGGPWQQWNFHNQSGPRAGNLSFLSGSAGEAIYDASTNVISSISIIPLPNASTLNAILEIKDTKRQYRIQCMAPVGQPANTSAQATKDGGYQSFVASVSVDNWGEDPGEETTVILQALSGNTGYFVALDSASVSLYRRDDASTIVELDSLSIPFDPINTYRIVLTRYGQSYDRLQARVLQVTNTLQSNADLPVFAGELTVIDATYANSMLTPGIAVDNPVPATLAKADFDDFFASAGGSFDSDGDGLTDIFEAVFGFNPGQPGEAALDPEGDGVTNVQEQQAGSDPLTADTDLDGINDLRDADIDGDGIPNDVETSLVPALNPTSSLDGTIDSDSDTWINVDEYRLGSGIQDLLDTPASQLNSHQKVFGSEQSVADRFGSSVSISGSTAIIGAHSATNEYGEKVGVAYVYVKENGLWSEQARLQANDGAVNDSFGISVSLQDDTVAIGANGGDGLNIDSGAVYVFTRVGSVWTESAKLIASDGSQSDNFGLVVSSDTDSIIVGAPTDNPFGSNSGSAYVFHKTNGVWLEEQKLTAGASQGDADDRFGDSVAIVGDTALVGAPTDDNAGNNAGMVYAFTRSGMTWGAAAEIPSVGVSADDRFGTSIALDNGNAAIGAIQDDTIGGNAGAVYVFSYSGAGFSQLPKLVAPDGSANDNFGRSLSLDDGILLIGAQSADTGASNAGAAYIAKWSAGSWNLEPRLFAADGATSDWFGWHAAVSGGEMLVGAMLNDDLGNNSGAAYFFTLNKPVLSVNSFGENADMHTVPLINGSASDTTGIDRVELEITDSSGSSLAGVQILCTSNCSAFSYDPSSLIFTPGTDYTIEITAYNTGGFTTAENISFTFVDEKASRLLVSLSSQSILSQGEISVDINLSIPSDSIANLSGIPLTVKLIQPGGSPLAPFINLTTDSSGAASISAIGNPEFNQAGEWQVQVDFAGSGQYLASTVSESLQVAAGSVAGYALIVVGQEAGGQQHGLASHERTAQEIYLTLIQRELVDANIDYFSFNTGSEIDYDPDVVGKATVGTSIQSFAAKMNANPAPLYIFMIDHGVVSGGGSEFSFGNAFDGAAASITPTELDGWLDNFENDPVFTNPEALLQPRVVIIGACFSGGFIEELSTTNWVTPRTIITSAASDEVGLKGEQLDGVVRPGSFFIQELLSPLFAGESFSAAFQIASNASAVNSKKVNAQKESVNHIPYTVQHPQLDDNSDGESVTSLDTSGVDTNADGVFSNNVYLGTSPAAIIHAQALEFTDAVVLPSGMSAAETETDLKVKIDNPGAGVKVYAIIRQQDKVLPYGNLDESDITEQVDLATQQFELLQGANGCTSVEYCGTATNLDVPGTMTVDYYAVDTTTGATKRVARGFIFKARAANTPPSAFDLVSPDDGASLDQTLVGLRWEKSSDEDGLGYLALVCSDQAALNSVFTGSVLSNPETLAVALGNTAVLANCETLWSETRSAVFGNVTDGVTYHWQVVAVDSFGALTFSTSQFQFTISLDSNGFGWNTIRGLVQSASDFSALSSFQVQGLSYGFEDQGQYQHVVLAGAVLIVAEDIQEQHDPQSAVFSNVLASPAPEVVYNFLMEPNVSWLPAPDYDGDGLRDCIDYDGDGVREVYPACDDDSDADGIPDNVEDPIPDTVSFAYSFDETDIDNDGDGDGLSNIDEYTVYSTDLNNPDHDGDGLGDGWEVEFGFNPLLGGEELLDNDGDNLTNIDEFNAGTDPFEADTDSDGLNDDVETNTGAYVSPSDTGSDPTVADTDSDGINDGDEVTAGFNPVDSLDPLPNDNFSNAVLIAAIDSTVQGDSTYASMELGESDHAGVTAGASVWWHWQPTVSRLIHINTRGSDFDTALGVYTGTAVNALTQVAANDNETTNLVQLHSGVQFYAQANTDYYIAVAGVSSATGNIMLEVNAPRTTVALENLIVDWTMTNAGLPAGQYGDDIGPDENIEHRYVGSSPDAGYDDIRGDFLSLVNNEKNYDSSMSLLIESGGAYFSGSLNFLSDKDFTISGWARADTIGFGGPIFSIGDSWSAGANHFIGISVDADGKLRGGIRGQPNVGNNTTTYAITPSGQVIVGQWFHYALVRDRTASTLTLYYNGSNGSVVAGPEADSVTIFDPINPPDPPNPQTWNDLIVLGANINQIGEGVSLAGVGSVSNVLDGDIGETFIWDKALSATDIETFYNQQAVDADQDGIDDSAETFTADSDSDGVLNYLDLDSDNDGLFDSFEATYGLNPIVAEIDDDPDNDLLTNLEEQLLGTNPTLADTDGDGIDDGDEIAAGSDPLIPDISVPVFPIVAYVMLGMFLIAARRTVTKSIRFLS